MIGNLMGYSFRLYMKPRLRTLVTSVELIQLKVTKSAYASSLWPLLHPDQPLSAFVKWVLGELRDGDILLIGEERFMTIVMLPLYLNCNNKESNIQDRPLGFSLGRYLILNSVVDHSLLVLPSTWSAY